MSLIDFADKTFGDLKKKDPKKAHRTSYASSGEPFGLYADTDAYKTSKTIDAEFDEDGNLISDLDNV